MGASFEEKSWRAESNSSWVLGAGAFTSIVALALPVERVWIANGLLLALFLSEVLKHVLQLAYYRRGI
jgi:ABC-type spermidine/putrescine transport system permease subunit II